MKQIYKTKQHAQEETVKLSKDFYYENGVSLLKQFYHVDTIFKAQGLFWFCNAIDDIEYEEV